MSKIDLNPGYFGWKSVYFLEIIRFNWFIDFPLTFEFGAETNIISVNNRWSIIYSFDDEWYRYLFPVFMVCNVLTIPSSTVGRPFCMETGWVHWAEPKWMRKTEALLNARRWSFCSLCSKKAGWRHSPRLRIHISTRLWVFSLFFVSCVSIFRLLCVFCVYWKYN